MSQILKRSYFLALTLNRYLEQNIPLQQLIVNSDPFANSYLVAPPEAFCQDRVGRYCSEVFSPSGGMLRETGTANFITSAAVRRLL